MSEPSESQAAPFRFVLQDNEGDPRSVPISGDAADVESAIAGAWALSRHHEWLVDIFDQRDGAPVKIAEVGVRWVDQDDEQG